MLVSDLRHFLDLGEDAPGPARALARHLGEVVRAATAGDAGAPWTTALACRRRPGRRPCPGRLVVCRPEATASIQWACEACGDEGFISGWEDSAFDLRQRGLWLAGELRTIEVSQELAATLRDIQLLDLECERVVYRIRAQGDRAVLAATEEDLEELIGAVAAEANHEFTRRRQQRLDAVVTELEQALATRGQ